MFYLDLFKTLNEEGLRYLVVGGVAVNLYGVVRLTMDVDIAVDPDPDQAHLWPAVLQRLRLQTRVPVGWKDIYDPVVRTRLKREKNLIAFGLVGLDPETPAVDILFDLPGPFGELYARRRTTDVDGVSLPLIGIDDLMAMKRAAGRAKDLSDLNHLRRIQHET